jgi:hypothetical protein
VDWRVIGLPQFGHWGTPKEGAAPKEGRRWWRWRWWGPDGGNHEEAKIHEKPQPFQVFIFSFWWTIINLSVEVLLICC